MEAAKNITAKDADKFSKPDDDGMFGGKSGESGEERTHLKKRISDFNFNTKTVSFKKLHQQWSF